MKGLVLRSIAALSLLLVPLFPAVQPASAQTSVASSINGIVTDSSGAVVPGANVTVTNKGTQETFKTTSNASGYYTVPNVPSGDYDVRVEKEGFEACLNRGVHLDPAQSVESSCALKVGQVSQTVEVQASAVNVDVSDTKVERTVNSTQMEQLPVNGRNFVSLLGLQPGVVQSFSFNSFQAMSLFASQCTMVNGQSGESNNLLIDGAPSTRTRANGATVGMPSMDAIGEVNIVTTGYMPEYSRAAGGQMVIDMKSGTDQYHGDVYEFLRNDALDSRYFFSSTVPKLDYNDFGFTIGGPVIPHKHKLYFFWAEEWQRQVTGNTEVGQVPSMEDRMGNLAPYCQAFASSCPKVPGYLNGVDGLVAGQPFPNDTIPAPLLSPNGQAMVSNFYLMPNTKTNLSTLDPYEGGNNLIYLYNTPNDARIDDVKGDYNINDKNHLAVTLRHYANVSSNAGTGSGGGSALLDQAYHFPSRGATIDYTTTFSPTLLNDFTITSTEDIVHVFVPAGGANGNGLDRTSLGVNFPYILGAASKDDPGKIPTLIMQGGFEQVSGLPYPSGSTGHVYTLQDVLTNVRGNHTLKAGFWFEHDGENDHDQVRVSPGGGVGNNLNGQFEFNASGVNTTGAGIADTLLGNFDNYSELGWRDYTPWYAHQIGVFGQDSWRVSSHLTIQGGMRWDYFQPYHSNWCNFGMFNPEFYSFTPGTQQVVNPTTGFITSGNPYNGIATPCQALPKSAEGHYAVLGQELTASNLASVNQELRNLGMQRGLSDGIIASRWDDVQPRLGFAWDPKGDGKTSVRGGAGIFYNHNTLSDVTLMGGNTPFQLATETFNGRADCPGDAFPGAAGCSAPTTPPNLPIPETGTDLVNKTPVVYSWNFSVQHEFLNSTLVEVGYVGNRGAHLANLNADLNQPAIGTFNNPANAAINQDVLRPYPGIGGAMTTVDEAQSEYNALQVSVQRRFTNNLQYNVSYTYSKCFDQGDSIYSVAADTYDPRFNWQVCGFNQTHNLTVTYIYNIPFLRHNSTLLGKTLGGWEVSGDVALVSGFNDTVSASSDYLGNGAQSIGATLPAYIKPGCSTRGSRTFSQFFNTSCFYEPDTNIGPGSNNTGLVGSAAYNLIEGPGIDNFDFALIKNGTIWERHNVSYQFRGEFFNFFNHPSFNGIDTGVTDGAFGQVNSAVSPRNIQLGLKIIF